MVADSGKPIGHRSQIFKIRILSTWQCQLKLLYFSLNLEINEWDDYMVVKKGIYIFKLHPMHFWRMSFISYNLSKFDWILHITNTNMHPLKPNTIENISNQHIILYLDIIGVKFTNFQNTYRLAKIIVTFKPNCHIFWHMTVMLHLQSSLLSWILTPQVWYDISTPHILTPGWKYRSSMGVIISCHDISTPTL